MTPFVHVCVAAGASDGTVGSPLSGAHGSLTLKGDGSYSYAVNQSDPVVQALNDGIGKYLEGPAVKPVFRKYN